MQRHRDAVHAADRLEQRWADVVIEIGGEEIPQIGLQQILQTDRFRVDGLAAQSAAGIDFDSRATCSTLPRRDVAEILIEPTDMTQRFEQLFLVFMADRAVERALVRRFRQQLRDVAAVIGLHMPIALRFAAERFFRMHVRVVVESVERFQRHLEALGVIEHAEVVIRQSPRARIDVQARIEFAFLFESAEFGVFVAAAQRPRTSARALVVFENLDVVAGLAQFVGGDETGETCAQNDHRSAAFGAVEDRRVPCTAIPPQARARPSTDTSRRRRRSGRCA